MSTNQKPGPVVNEWARPYWDYAKQNKFCLQQCNDCGKHIFYPRIACPHCGSSDVKWVEVSGKGRIYSYTVVENNAPSAFQADVPYVVAIIKLEEGVQLLSNVVECDPYQLEFDMPVEVVFEKLDEEVTLPKFRPVKG
ncbi:MAG: Zn-ribbon domain-containing OB-fold protein [Proteobacteria bacterium]|nr:Zn-ribbon domain-containing OB-fold protein [Pseudomonadota bacterium]MBU1450703.1 Zn-ribbon domain-containing OB-fold protein [Pseudomonadota bacterium]MBU2468642.1 Zn-ribbon domain-containing OB-fold protein [Pseudomonadota bacterium]MBU2517678.1 Zn-ribbon domain-containing OB-fold protein [Pseudomonadota bacterium]